MPKTSLSFGSALICNCKAVAAFGMVARSQSFGSRLPKPNKNIKYLAAIPSGEAGGEGLRKCGFHPPSENWKKYFENAFKMAKS